MPRELGGTVSLLGVKLEHVPKAVLVVLALALAGGVGWLAWWTQIRQPEFALITAKQANDSLQASVNEYGRHIAESPESAATLLDDVRGRLVAQRYSDGCLILARVRNGRTRSKLILDLDFEPVPASAGGTWWIWGPDLIAKVEAATRELNTFSIEPISSTQQPANRCWNPHPGNFETWYGERRECWVEVWRRWPDSCQHVQWLESCRGVWQANQDGTPMVRWTSCVH